MTHDIETGINKELAEMDVIDCHEHLGPEETRTSQPVDVFTLFSFESYTGRDLASAGMDADSYGKLLNNRIPLEERWKLFSRYWEVIRHTSYSRSILEAVRGIYGFDDITKDNYIQISESMQKNNNSGIYKRILQEKCGIQKCLNDVSSLDVDPELFIPLIRVLMWDVDGRENLFYPDFAPGAVINSLDNYLDTAKEYIAASQKLGAVGLKMAAIPFQHPDRKKAESCFKTLKDGRVDRIAKAHNFPNYYCSSPLRDYIVNELISYAGKLDMVVAVHTGYWGDFRNLQPSNIIPIIQEHPEVRFDIFHLGYPYVRETLMLGKGFHNVWLNFCWTHIISQRTAIDALDEAIDLVPSNKILAFGGDYSARVIELVYGHLVMARENIAKVLSRRIKNGSIKEDKAINLAKQWFWDNPVKLYRLDPYIKKKVS
jgi:uncharacterized protein